MHIIPWHHALPAGMGIRFLGRIRRVVFRAAIKHTTLAQSLRRHIPLVPVDGECLERGAGGVQDLQHEGGLEGEVLPDQVSWLVRMNAPKTISAKDVLKEKGFLKEKCFLTK